MKETNNLATDILAYEKKRTLFWFSAFLAVSAMSLIERFARGTSDE